MADKTVKLTGSRAYQDIGTIGSTTAQLSDNIQSINANLDVGLRNTRNIIDSFLRVSDVVALGLATLDGNILSAAPAASGTVISADSITGDGSAGTPLQLVGDSASPGNSYYYGTNSSGTKGYYALPGGGGGGSVTSVAVSSTDLSVAGSPITTSGTFTLNINAGAVTLAKMANLAADSIIGNNTGSPATPLALTASQVKTLLAIAYTDVSGLATVAHTGAYSDLTGTPSFVTSVGVASTDLSVSGSPITSSGNITLNINSGAVTLAKMANLAADSIIGNNTGSPATPLALTASQVKTLLAIAYTDVSGLATVAHTGAYSDLTGTPTIPTAANPTAKVALTAVNGSATTFMRSDAAPPLDVTIAPTWTGDHTFTPTSGTAITVNSHAATNGVVIQAADSVSKAFQAVDGGANNITAAIQTTNTEASLRATGTTPSLGFYTGGTQRATISSAGGVTINAPTTSTVTALTVNAVANTTGSYAAQLNGSTTVGNSWGLLVQAGTNSTDAALNVIGQNGGANYLIIYGDGHGEMGPSGATGLFWTAAGNMSIGAPTSALALQVSAAASYPAAQFSGNSANGAWITIQNTQTSNYAYALCVNRNVTDAFAVHDENRNAYPLSIASTGATSIATTSSGVALTVNGLPANGDVAQFVASTTGQLRVSIIQSNTSSGDLAELQLSAGTTGFALFASNTSQSSALITGGPTGAQGVLRSLGSTAPLVLGANNTYAWGLDVSGVACPAQPAPTAVNATATLTIAQLLTQIITSTTAAAVTGTLPTGTLADAGLMGGLSGANTSFDWSVINTGSNAFTVAAGSGHTLVGSGTVAAAASGRFRSRKTATNTFVTYRLGS
jgi:hypothetical protein